MAAAVVEPGADLLVLTETGFGKRVPVGAFSRKHRGTQGVRLIPLEGRKTGPVVAVRQVSEADEEVILISAEGQVVRTKLESIATRNDGSSQGVRVMTLREGDKVAGIAAFRTGLAKRDADGENEEAPEGEASPPRAKAAKVTAKAAPKTVSKGKAKPAAKVKAKKAKTPKPRLDTKSSRNRTTARAEMKATTKTVLRPNSGRASSWAMWLNQAGMGGGSSDAASTLLALNRLWGLNLSQSALEAIGLKLGADIPFFLRGHNAWVEGIGETITPLEKAHQLPQARFAIVKPAAGLETKLIFSSPNLKRDSDSATILGFAAAHFDFGRNDLQPVAQALCPEVTEAIEWLDARGLQGRMTGSGSAVFAHMSHAVDLSGAPQGWQVKECENLMVHPLAGWASGKN